MDDILPLSHDSTNHRMLELLLGHGLHAKRVVDVGAGEGYFSKLLAEHLETFGGRPAEMLRACDVHPELFKYPRIPCDAIRASGELPYDDASFDLACSVEVIEHVEDQFKFVRELHRIVKPGGVVLVSTPNLLNINSRLRFLHSGFWLLFNPLPLGTHDSVHTSGHINPVTAYYLAYMFHRSGFSRVALHIDRRKRSAMALAALLAPWLVPAHFLFRLRQRRRSARIYDENSSLVHQVNGWDLLTARSVIVEAIR